MGRLGDKAPWLAAAAVVLAVVVVASVDHARAENRIPPIPPLCSPDTVRCNDARDRKFLPRLQEIRRLDRDFDGRSWIYAIVVTAGTVGAAIVAVGRRSPEKRRREFSRTGVFGVMLGLAGVGVLAAAGSEINPPALAVFLPCLAVLGCAAVGGGLMRLQGMPKDASLETTVDRDRTMLFGHRLAIAALGFTVLTVLLAWIFAGQQSGSCDLPNNPPGWTAPLPWAAVITACAAGLCALLGLAGRRWFVALLSFVVNPAALIYMALSTGALC